MNKKQIARDLLVASLVLATIFGVMILVGYAVITTPIPWYPQK